MTPFIFTIKYNLLPRQIMWLFKSTDLIILSQFYRYHIRWLSQMCRNATSAHWHYHCNMRSDSSLPHAAYSHVLATLFFGEKYHFLYCKRHTLTLQAAGTKIIPLKAPKCKTLPQTLLKALHTWRRHAHESRLLSTFSASFRQTARCCTSHLRCSHDSNSRPRYTSYLTWAKNLTFSTTSSKANRDRLAVRCKSKNGNIRPYTSWQAFENFSKPTG